MVAMQGVVAYIPSSKVPSRSLPELDAVPLYLSILPLQSAT